MNPRLVRPTMSKSGSVTAHTSAGPIGGAEIVRLIGTSAGIPPKSSTSASSTTRPPWLRSAGPERFWLAIAVSSRMEEPVFPPTCTTSTETYSWRACSTANQRARRLAGDPSTPTTTLLVVDAIARTSASPSGSRSDSPALAPSAARRRSGWPFPHCTNRVRAAGLRSHVTSSVRKAYRHDPSGGTVQQGKAGQQLLTKRFTNEAGVGVEQRDTEIFLTLADELHFGRTAERLHVSTARVSQTIKKMERRIGAPLFERTSRRVELTPIGRRLHDDLRPAYQQIQQGLDRAINAARGVRGVLRVGFFGAAAGRFVLEVAEAFHTQHPECDVQIRENQFSDGLDNLLRAGNIEMLLAIFPIREPDLTTGVVLFRENRLLAVSARHPFARRPSVSFSDLARDKVLRSPPAIPDYWDQMLIPPRTPTADPRSAGQRSPPSRKCSPWSARAEAAIRCPPRHVTTTSAPTSPTSRSMTQRRSSGDSPGRPRPRPTWSAPSTAQPPRSQRPVEVDSLARIIAPEGLLP